MVSKLSPKPDTILDIMRESDVFVGISDVHLKRILENSSEESYPDGAIIVNQSSTNRSFFLILDGQVEVIRIDPQTGQEFLITKLESGDEFGELSLVLEGERSATIRACGDVRVLQLSVSELDRLRHSEPESAYGSLMGNLATEIGKKLVLTDDLTVERLRSELELVRDQAAMAHFIVLSTVIMTVYSFALVMVNEFSDNILVTDVFSNLAIVLLLVGIVIMIVRSPYTVSMFGLRAPRNWLKHLTTTAVWTLGVMLIAILLKWIAVQTVPALEGFPMFFWPWETYPGFEEITARFGIGLIIGYMILAPVQEFMARGVWQGSMTQFFVRWRYKHVIAILLTNGMFAASHLYLSPGFGIVTFFVGCVWGVQYLMDRTIIGISISHIIIGLFGLRVLGLTTMLELVGL